MTKIKITADSICDLTPAILAEHDFAVFPLIINLGDDSRPDGPDIADAIYEFAARTKTTPKTSARSAAEYAEFFRAQLPQDGALIHFNISGDISSTHQNAVVASREFKNVYVIDSRSLTTGTGILMLKAAALRDQGLDAPTIVERINAVRDQLQCSFIVKDLTFLHRGGRCSGTTRLFASALHIKPQIILTDGKMVPGKKYIGSFPSCVKKYVADTLRTYNHPDLSYCFITHSVLDDPQIVEQVRAQVLTKYPFQQVIETKVGGTVTAHCGKNTIGIIYGLQ